MDKDRQSGDPDFVIAGAQKSATTFASSVLNNIPGVHVEPGELPWLESPYYEAGGADRIRYNLRGSASAEVVGFKRANYFTAVGVADRLSVEFPYADVVIILRDPVSRAFSATLHYMEYGHIPFENPNIALAKLLDGRDQGAVRGWEILEWGRYRKYAIEYSKAIGANRLHFVDQAKLVSKPVEVLRTIPSLHDIAAPNSAPARTNAGSTGLPDLWLRRKMHQALTGHDSSTGRLLPRTQNPIRLGVGYAWKTANRVRQQLAVGESGPLSIDPGLAARLAEFYSPDIEYARNELGIYFRNISNGDAQ